MRVLKVVAIELPILLPAAILCAIAAPFLSGCMALALAPAAMAVGGIANSSRGTLVTVTVDQQTFTPEIRATLANAKSLAIVAGDRSAIKAADLFETRGGYTVTIDRPSAKVGEMTSSERRDVLRKLCVSPCPDVALIGRTTRTETGNMLMGAVTGRANVKNEWAMDILECRTDTARTFGGTFEFDAGMWNPKVQSEHEEMIGAEIGGKILDAIGRGAGQVAGAASTANMPQVRQEASSVATSAVQKAEPRKSISTLELQQRLQVLGYKVGNPDGIAGKLTTDALKKFQQDNQLAVSGVADDETWAKLTQKTAGKTLKAAGPSTPAVPVSQSAEKSKQKEL
jgi:hypothetical protein